jgi:sugar/nucleoside kinase (ribokinase family)
MGDVAASYGSAIRQEAGAVMAIGLNRHPGSGGPAATVIGGTYLDIELMVDSHIRADVSLEVWHRSSSLGGPGFCYALELAGLGVAVDLITKLGSCRASSEARRMLREHGVSSEAVDEVVDADLDIATLVIDPAGRKLAFNEHRLASTIECDPSALRPGRPLLVASPTPLRTVLEIVRTCSQWGWRLEVFFAPHSRQIAEFAELATPSRELLCSAITVACLNAEDLTPDFETALRELSITPCRCWRWERAVGR